MEAQIYQSSLPRRSALWAVFAKAARWSERGGHQNANWTLHSEVDLSAPGRPLPFDPVEARQSITTNGAFTYLDQPPPKRLETWEETLLNSFRLHAIVPLVRERGEGLEILGTGTLFTHEDRYFLVTADHIFRKDKDDNASALIDLRDVAVPSRPGDAVLITLGSHEIYRIAPPVRLDVIVLELRDPETTRTLKANWTFLPFGQVDEPQPGERFVICGFPEEGATLSNDVLRQRFLNLETDFLLADPAVKEPAPGYDLFFYLQREGLLSDGSRRRLGSLVGLSGGSIWAIRPPSEAELWTPSKVCRIIAVQSSEMEETWSRGVHWRAVRQILGQPELGFRTPLP